MDECILAMWHHPIQQVSNIFGQETISFFHDLMKWQKVIH
jgi:hypothetical protein